jgi:hypothetical protein
MSSGFVSGWDYDNAPTDPRTGGKLTAAMAVERIKELEEALRNLVALEVGRARHGTFAYVRSGPSLALCLNDARRVLGMEDDPLGPPA